MADDVIATLEKLTPAAPNRDAILFAAGRASARRSPIWKWLALGLLISNAITLSLWMFPQKQVLQQPDRPGNDPVPNELSTPAGPTIPFDRSASIWNLEAKAGEPVPSSSVPPEEHWSVRTAPADMRFD